MKTTLFTAALFVVGHVFLAGCWVLDKIRGTPHPRLSEHDRFADRAVYSEDPAIDPMALHKEGAHGNSH